MMKKSIAQRTMDEPLWRAAKRARAGASQLVGRSWAHRSHPPGISTLIATVVTGVPVVPKN
jgi:hypothetical protein